MAPDGFSSGMLSGIDVSAGSLGKMAKLALGRARTVAILPYPGALDVNTTRRAMPDSEADRSLTQSITQAPGGKALLGAAHVTTSAHGESNFLSTRGGAMSADFPRWGKSSGDAKRTPCQDPALDKITGVYERTSAADNG